IVSSAKVPIYGLSTPYVGHGAVGGYVSSAAGNGARAWEIAMRIANGTRAQDIRVESGPTVPLFDWHELQRWRINEDDLPTGSIVQFKELSLWDQHKQLVVSTAALMILQTGLIGWLLVEHRRRRVAEEARRDLAAIVESSNDAIIATSPTGEVRSWNSGAE